jgi:hypothetical protein
MATWFAQNSSVNIDSVNQWNSAANGSGSWLTWASLGAADILVANGKTSITINVNVTCAKLTTAATGGTAGGGFIKAAGVTITATIEAGTTACVTRNAAGADSYIIGDCNSTSSNAVAFTNASTGTVYITGNGNGGTGSSARAILNSSTGTIILTGNGVAGNNTNGHAIDNSGNGTVTVTGNVTGGQYNANGVNNAAAGVVTVTGTATGGALASETALSRTSHGIQNRSTGTVTLNGSAVGGGNPQSFGLYNSDAGTVYMNGTITASNSSPGVGNVAVNGNTVGLLILNTSSLTSSSSGMIPIESAKTLMHESNAMDFTFRVNNAGVPGVARTLYTGGVNLNQPAVANVRSGTVFGASNEYTGTLAVPSASLVALGVSTDNTTGTYNPQPALLIDTTIAVRTSETVFTLTAGSTDDSAYVGQTVIVTKNGSTTRKEIGTVSAYVGSTKQITLSSDPGVMTIAAGDAICIFAGSSSGGGGGGLDAAGVRAAVGLASANLDAQLSDISTKTANLPSDPADQSIIVAATEAILTAVDGVQSDTNDIQTRIPVALDGGRIAAVLDSTATAALVDLIWDEPLTGATHNVATSSGKRLRQTTAFQQIDSTVIDASATTTTFVTGLTSSVDNFYNDSMLVFTDGALAGQVRAIYDYIGATKTIVLAEALTSAPVNGVAFAIVSLHIHPVSQIQSGLATSAALATESTKINRIEAVATGTVTGAGTSTEVFVGPSATLTITVDSSGNRSAVVVT